MQEKYIGQYFLKCSLVYSVCLRRIFKFWGWNKKKGQSEETFINTCKSFKHVGILSYTIKKSNQKF